MVEKKNSNDLTSKEKQEPSKQHSIDQLLLTALSMTFFGFFIYHVVADKKNNKRTNKRKKQKVNDFILDSVSTSDLEELVELSMTNINAFYLKFEDVFPNLYDALTQCKPELSDSEIKFCMYLKMGYSTKEIAIYTNSTIKSVESRKYRLKRKLKDSSSKNLLKQLNFNDK